MPWSASLLSVGVLISPPNVEGCPKPTSSINMISTLGASLRKWLCSGRRWCLESCNLGAATLADGTGGNGRTEPSAGAAVCTRCASATLRGRSWDAPSAIARMSPVDRAVISLSLDDGIS
jgi:Fe-S-cluster-containing dehydrogenase component